jgi:hypothetical protein
MENFNVLLEPVRAFLVEVGAFLPRIAVAIAVLVAGWLIGKGLRFAAVRGLRAINFNIVTERAGLDGFLRQGGLERDTTDLVGALVYWLVILGALVIASNGLGLTYVTEVLSRVLLFLPRVFVALLVLTLGAYFAQFIGGAVQTYCHNVDIRDAELLGRIAQYAILMFVLLIALEPLDIGGNILRQAFLILFGGVVLALALAFGIGGQKWAASLLERWWPTQREAQGDPPESSPGTKRPPRS